MQPFIKIKSLCEGHNGWQKKRREIPVLSSLIPFGSVRLRTQNITPFPHLLPKFTFPDHADPDSQEAERELSCLLYKLQFP